MRRGEKVVPPKAARLIRHVVCLALLGIATALVTWVVWSASRPTIVIRWPLSLRGTTDRLYVDEQPFAVPMTGSNIIVRVMPGEHDIRLDRVGFHPVRQTTRPLGWRDSVSLTPEWQLNDEGAVHEDLLLLTDEVTALQAEPVFKQRKTKIRLQRFARDVGTRDPADDLSKTVRSLGESLRSPLSRRLLREDSGSPDSDLRTIGSGSMRHVGSVTAIEFAPNGEILASGGLDGRVSVHDSANGKKILDVDQHSAAITGIRFASQNRLVSIDQAGLVCLTDLASRSTRQLFQANGTLWTVAILDAKSIVVGGAASEVQLLDLDRGNVVTTIKTRFPVQKLLGLSANEFVAVSPQGEVLVVQSETERLRLKSLPPKFVGFERRQNRLTITGVESAATWNFKNGNLVTEFKPMPGLIAFAEDRSWSCATREQDSSHSVLFRLHENDTEYRFPLDRRVPRVADYDETNGRAAIGTLGGAVLLMSLETDATPIGLLKPSTVWQRVRFGRAAHRLAAASADGGISVFRTFDWKREQRIEGEGVPLDELLFSSATDRVIAVHQDGIKIHSLGNGSVVELQGTSPAVLTDDDRYLVYCEPRGESKSMICVYDLFRGKMEPRTPTEFRIKSLLPQPSQGSLLVGTATRGVRLLSWKTGKDRQRKRRKGSTDAKALEIRSLSPTKNDDIFLILQGGKLSRWSSSTGATTRVKDVRGRVDSLHVVGNRTLIAAGNELRSELDGAAASIVLPVGQNAVIRSVSFTDNGHFFAACVGDGRLIVGSLNRGTETH
ncbi:MAG: WD40 repeat domain-containing protein [Planctomycetota bacterium]